MKKSTISDVLFIAALTSGLVPLLLLLVKIAVSWQLICGGIITAMGLLVVVFFIEVFSNNK